MVSDLDKLAIERSINWFETLSRGESFVWHKDVMDLIEDSFKAGAKWAEQRMRERWPSEEEIDNAVLNIRKQEEYLKPLSDWLNNWLSSKLLGDDKE